MAIIFMDILKYLSKFQNFNASEQQECTFLGYMCSVCIVYLSVNIATKKHVYFDKIHEITTSISHVVMF